VLWTVDRLAEEAGIQEVSRRQKLSQRKVTPHILRQSHVVNALMAGVPAPMIPKPGGAQEALYDGDLRHCGAGAGEVQIFPHAKANDGSNCLGKGKIKGSAVLVTLEV